jgi:hypothetical protein
MILAKIKICRDAEYVPVRFNNNAVDVTHRKERSENVYTRNCIYLSALTSKRKYLQYFNHSLGH